MLASCFTLCFNTFSLQVSLEFSLPARVIENALETARLQELGYAFFLLSQLHINRFVWTLFSMNLVQWLPCIFK